MRTAQRPNSRSVAPATAPQRAPPQRASNAEKPRAAGPCACGGGCPRCRSTSSIGEFPHHGAIARAFGLAGFSAPAVIDPSVDALGAEAATEQGRVRFARPPSLQVAAHEAAHVMQGRRPARTTDAAGAERHAQAVAERVSRGWGAADLVGRGLVRASTHAPLLFTPPVAAPATYTAVAGDTFETISLAVYGAVGYGPAIQAANAGKATVAAGDVITLPDHPDPADPWVTPELAPLLRRGGHWTQVQAEAAVTSFAAQSAAIRDAMVARYLRYNNYGPMLYALPANSTQPGGTHEAAARDLLQRIQRVGARADAAAQGLATEADMAAAQGTEMTARNQAAAAAALPSGSPPPTTAQVAAQQAAQVATGSIAPQTAVMTAARETALNSNLNTVSIPDFVTWVGGAHPSLGITAAHLRADARAIFDRGQSIIAFADGSLLRAVVGEAFADMVAANPAYALPTIVHEVWGHNTYEGQGNYGNAGAAYGLDIYDRAAATMPGYVRPADGTPARLSEIDNYGYHETEMYSLMREVPYYTPNAAAHSALASVNYDPAPEIQNRMQMIKDGYEPRVGRALVRGLYVRFAADPTVGGMAMVAFRKAVKNVFAAADATAILA